jgi:nucleoside phosphorylase
MNSSEVKSLGLCPLKMELQGLVAGLRDLELPCETLAKNQFWLPKHGLLLALGGHGKAEFASRASSHLAHLPNCERLYCLGTAGALTDELKPLDVVVASTTIEHDYYEKFDPSKNKPQFKGAIDELSFAKMAESLKNCEFKTWLAPIASGDEDIVTNKRAKEIANLGAIAVAWEGAGGARAARNLNKEFVEIRGVSDDCDENTVSHFAENLPIAMKNLSTVLYQIMHRD